MPSLKKHKSTKETPAPKHKNANLWHHHSACEVERISLTWPEAKIEDALTSSLKWRQQRSWHFFVSFWHILIYWELENAPFVVCNFWDINSFYYSFYLFSQFLNDFFYVNVDLFIHLNIFIIYSIIFSILYVFFPFVFVLDYVFVFNILICTFMDQTFNVLFVLSFF